MNRIDSGFSMIELIISTALSCFVLILAVPSVQSARHAAHSAEAKLSLLSGISQSVHKAALHGVHTTLCPSNNGQTCSPGFDWSAGWIGFIDQNTNRERDNNEFIYVQQATLEQVRLISSSGRARIVFQGNGGNAGSNATFTLCDQRGAAKAQSLVLGNWGQLRNGTPNATQIALACTL